MKQRIRFVIMFAICALALQLVGCAQMTMTPPKPSIENTVKLRGTGLAPAALGSFTLDARNSSNVDKGLSIRTNNLSSPIDGSFSQYLRETLKVELQSVGLFDPKANVVISGSLVDSNLDASIGTGKASLAARFLVSRAENVRYDRELRVQAVWDSPFMGVSAIPLAAGQYEALYRKLIGELLDDASFRRAIAKD